MAATRVRLTILLCAGALLLGAGPSSADNGQVTDAQANCTYGTRAIAATDYVQPGSVATLQDFFQLGNQRPTDPCYATWGWAPDRGARGVSYLVAGPQSAFSGPGNPSDPPEWYQQVLCNGFDDPRCAASRFAAMPSGGLLRMTASFFHCDSEADTNCVSSVDVIAPDGSTQAARFEREFPNTPKVAGATWPSKAADGSTRTNAFSPGRNGAVWAYTTPEGTREITTTGYTDFTSSVKPGDASGLDGKATWNYEFASMKFQVLPVAFGVQSEVGPPLAEEHVQKFPNGFTSIGVYATNPQRTDPEAGRIPSTPGCWTTMRVAFDFGECEYETTFPTGYRYRVTLQLADIAGFNIIARLDAPVVYSEPSASGHRLIVEAAPSKSYLVYARVPKATMTPALIAAWKADGLWNPNSWNINPVDIAPMVSRFPDFLAALAPYYGNTATVVYPTWTMEADGGVGRTPMSPQCQQQVKGQVVSITSTNATAFDQAGPQFNNATKTFSFKLSAPHFEPDGKTLSVGHYYMNMNAKFMQCVLGTSKVPEQASIALDYANGEENVATVAVHQDGDWLRLSADNFHYSAPRITVAFANAQPTATPSASATASAQPVPKATVKRITCLKGKQRKVISGSNPKCPTGWKRA